jgi:hypothetical protein
MSSSHRPIAAPETLRLETAFEPGPAPLLQWVSVADLVVDETYQRPIERRGRANIVRIAEAFDWSRFAPLIVAPVAGGKLAVIDGQHRATAAAARGVEQLPAMVVIADRARQAESFAAVNGQVTQISPLQLHKSRLAAGDAEALALDEVCRSAGVIVLASTRASTSMGVGETLAIGSLAASFRVLGPDRLRTVLRCLVAAAGEAPGMVNATSIKAVAQLVETRSDWTERHLVAAFEEIDLETELEDARVDAARRRRPMAEALSDRLRPVLNAALDVRAAA